MIYELTKEHLNTLTLDEQRGLYAEAKRQAALARPHTQGYARAVAAVGRINSACPAADQTRHHERARFCPRSS